MTFIPEIDFEEFEATVLLQTVDLERENVKLNDSLANAESKVEELRKLVREFADALIQHTEEIGYTPKAFEHIPEIVQRSRVHIRGLHLIKKG